MMPLLLPDAPVEQMPDALSGLEARLRGPAAPQALAEALEQLADLEYLVRQRMAEGAAPVDFRMLAATLDACEAARETLRAFVPAGPV